VTTFRYKTGEDIRKGDKILHHGVPARVEFIAVGDGDPDLDWYVQEFGGGVMLLDSEIGNVFIFVDQINEIQVLEFVSRG
jgi:hypothetical protein